MKRSFIDTRRASAALVFTLFSALAPAALAQGDPGSDIAGKPAEPEETTPAPDSDKEAVAKPPEPEPEAAPAVKKDGDPGEPQPNTKERERAVAAIGLEHLGGEAYPEPTTRGIHGGSLWLTMHGLQWPYMPALPGEPATRIGVSGSVWVDSSYARTDSGRPAADPHIIRWEQQARFVLRITPTYSTKQGFFAQGQAEFVANGAAPPSTAQLVDTDDLYVRAGKWNLFDVTAGRFQGWEVYHLGMALDLNTFERSGPYTNQNPASPAQIYGLTHYWDRPNGPGNLAIHFYAPKPLDMFRAEVLTQIGNAGGLQEVAVRPVGIFDWGMNLPGTQGYRISAKVKGGFEYGKDTPREQGDQYKEKVVRQGWAVSGQFIFDPYVEIGGGVGQGLLDRYNAQTGKLEYPTSSTTTTFGGFLNVQPVRGFIIGGGYHQSTQDTLKCTDVIPAVPPNTTPTILDCSEDATPSGNFDSYKLVQYFGAVQYEILPNLFTKLVLAHGKADYNKWSDTSVPPYSHETGKLLGLPLDMSARLRFMLLY